jgi:NAD(P)H dehydrogenase (quinone)
MIIVTGATGHFGSQVVEHLLQRIPAEQIGVSVRAPEAAAGLAARGVRVRHGDFSDPSTLDAAFEGATQVLVVSIDKLGDEGVAASVAAVDAAYRAGADRVLYTSHQAASPDSEFAPARDHAAVEAHLATLGRPYTSLRNGYYAESLIEYHLRATAGSGEIAVPADGPVAWTSRADLAEAAAALLTAAAPIDGPTPALTASEAVDLRTVAEMLSEGAGRRVTRVVVSDDEFLQGLIDGGVPEPFAQLFMGTYLAARGGEFATIDPTLEQLLGRPPRRIRDALRAAAQEWVA